MLSDVSEGELCVSNGGIGERTRGGGGFQTAAVYLFYEPTAVAADLTGIVHLFFSFFLSGTEGGKRKKGVRRP